MPIVTVRHAGLWLEPDEEQGTADDGCEDPTSNSDLMARGVAFDLLQKAK